MCVLVILKLIQYLKVICGKSYEGDQNARWTNKMQVHLWVMIIIIRNIMGKIYMLRLSDKKNWVKNEGNDAKKIKIGIYNLVNMVYLVIFEWKNVI